jgi:hypothetical protein
VLHGVSEKYIEICSQIKVGLWHALMADLRDGGGVKVCQLNTSAIHPPTISVTGIH